MSKFRNVASNAKRIDGFLILAGNRWDSIKSENVVIDLPVRLIFVVSNNIGQWATNNRYKSIEFNSVNNCVT